MTAGTLTLNAPSFPVERTTNHRSVMTSRDEGPLFARRMAKRPMRSWTLSWSNGHEGDRYLALYYFDLCAGGVLDLDWTTPDSEAVRVTIPTPPEIVRKSASTYDVRLTLEEVL